MDDRCVCRCLHNPGDRVRHVENEARGELSIRLTGINETWRVGNELARHHDVGHCVEEFVALLWIGFTDRDMRDHACDDIAPLFERVSFRVFQRIALAYYALGVQPKRQNLALEGNDRLKDFVLSRPGHLRATRRVHLFYLSRAGNRTRADFGDYNTATIHDRRLDQTGFFAGTTFGLSKQLQPLRSRVWNPSAAATSRLNQSRTHYTPAFGRCQYVVAIFFFNAIQCIS